MKTIFFVFLIFCIGIMESHSQMLSGKVVERDNKGNHIPLTGANIFYSDKSHGTVSDAKGNFNIALPTGDQQIIVSFVGYRSDTLKAPFSSGLYIVELVSIAELKAFEVKDLKNNKTMDRMNPLWNQQLNQGELQRCACCNLSEGFETNASVDVNFTDAVTGAKQIQLLGLSGVYTQMLVENLPFMRGIGASFGLEYIPGTWMESIQISKGTSSVNNGFESLTGQINTEYKKPEESERLFLNYFTSDAGRHEFNFNASQKMKNNVSSVLMAHYSFMNNEIDHNHDGFMDMPKMHQLNVANLWSYHGKKGEMFRWGVRILDDERNAGQTVDNMHIIHQVEGIYKSSISNRRYEVFSKTGKVFQNKPGTSIGWQNTLSLHEMNANVGQKSYNARQYSWYSNLLYMGQFKNAKHSYTTGATFVTDNVTQSLNGINGDLNEMTAGVFYQYTFTVPEKFSLLAAIRADYSNIHKGFFTPRLHLKYSISEKTTLRLVTGLGYRTPFLIAENLAALSTSRELVNPFIPFQEKGLNSGISIVHYIDILGKKMTFSLDYYYTHFFKSAYFDFERDTNFVYGIYSHEKSFSNAAQFELNYEPVDRLNLNAAFRYTTVYYTPEAELIEKPLINHFKGFISVGYATKMKKWTFDATAQWIGPAHLPDRSAFPEKYQIADYSPDYWMLGGQITKNYRYWGAYVGIENALDFTQKNPVISSENPYSNSFDAGIVWGPVMGRKFYAGVRLKIPYLDKNKNTLNTK